MTNPKIKFKRSSIEGKAPTISDLPLGEIAINTFDGRVYTARSTDSGVTTSIVNLSGINVWDSSTPVGFANTLNFTGSAITGIAFTVGIATITISTSANPSSKTISSFICTEGQTGFSTTYTAGYIDVFLNGVRLSESEFLASDGNNITLDVGASLNDVVDIIKYEPDLSDSYWTLTGTDIYRYSNVGINTIPTADLDVVGDVLVSGIVTASQFYGDGSNLTNTGSTLSSASGLQRVVVTSQTSGTMTSSATDANLVFDANSDALLIGSGTTTGTASQRLQVTGGAYVSGSVGIGTTNPTQSLDVSGNILASGTVTASSDKRLKTNIKTIDNALEKVEKLRGVEFDRKETGEHQIGVIAQEVEKIIPEVVYGDETKSVAYGNLTALLIEAIKEQQKQINELKEEINILKEN